MKHSILAVYCAVIVTCIASFMSVTEAAYRLPTDRAIPWQGNVGVLNDIPTRTSVCSTLIPSGRSDSTDAAAIQAAVNNCPAGQVVLLKEGTFYLSSSIRMKSGVTLRGTGMGTTILKGNAGMSGTYVVGTSGSSLGSSLSITSGFNKGSTTITTASAHGWSVGDLILIDQLNDATADPIVSSMGEGGRELYLVWSG